MSISDWSSDVCSSDLLTLHDLGAISLQPVETLARAVGDDHHAAVAGAEALLVAILGELALGAGVEHRIVFPELRQPDVIDVAVPAGEQNALVLAQEHVDIGRRSEEHTSELQSLMRISYAVFCLKKKTT